MDFAAKQRIKDIRNDIALLEMQLDRTDKNESIRCEDGRYKYNRVIILDQLLELRTRLRKEMEDFIDDV